MVMAMAILTESPDLKAINPNGLPIDRLYPEIEDGCPEEGRKPMIYADRQLKAIKMNASADTSFCLHGGGGYGKTEVTRRMFLDTAQRLERAKMAMIHPMWDEPMAPVLVLAYTNNAVENIRDRLPEEYKPHCSTIHKALGYYPVFYETVTPDGDVVTTVRWEYRFNENNPLEGIDTIFLDEATLPNLELIEHLHDAISYAGCRVVAIGDLQQQKPPFGQAFLAWACTRLPNIVLNKAFRQKDESPVTSLLFDYQKGRIGRILPPIGEPPEGLTSLEEEIWVQNNSRPTAKQIKEGYERFYDKYRGANEHGELDFTIIPKVGAETLIRKIQDRGYLRRFLEATKYSPTDSTIIMPYNKQFGTVVMSAMINTVRAEDAGQETHEVYVGFQKRHYAIGDILILDTRKVEIIDIDLNPRYTGLPFAQPAVGMERVDVKATMSEDFGTSDTIDSIQGLRDHGMVEDEDGNFLQLSHHILVRDMRTGKEKYLDSLKEQSSLIGGHATTTYKAQGLQFRNVIGWLHSSHHSLNREMLYTLKTRTTFRLHLICELDCFWKSTAKETLKGNGGEEKIEALRLNPIQYEGCDFHRFIGTKETTTIGEEA